tara:strand:+ start:345 stop:554 length:210 start_codon:yes stop_codon:yes gene_type:complete
MEKTLVQSVEELRDKVNSKDTEVIVAFSSLLKQAKELEEGLIALKDVVPLADLGSGLLDLLEEAELLNK